MSQAGKGAFFDGLKHDLPLFCPQPHPTNANCKWTWSTNEANGKDCKIEEKQKKRMNEWKK